jgi:hypothetical protein
MGNDTELVVRMAAAEQDLVAAVNGIMAQHSLPCFLMEPLLDKIHRQLIDGKTAELAAAQVRSRAEEDTNVNHT